MGNSKAKLLTPGSLKQAERNLLEFSDLSHEQYKVEKIIIEETETEDIHMTTILVGDPQKAPLVLCHGYGGSGTLFYRVIAGLAEHFYVIVIDLIGFGSSSRPKFTINDPH